MEGPKHQLIILFLMLCIGSNGREPATNRQRKSHFDMNEKLTLFRTAEISTHGIHRNNHFSGDKIAQTAISHTNYAAQGKNSYKEQIYSAYISGRMEIWKATLDAMEGQKSSDPEFLLQLINYQYGYVAWCLGNDKKPEAKIYLSLLEENLKKLKKESGETAEYHAYTAATYGFKIGLKVWRAPFYGPKSMKHAEEALETDSLSFHANMEMGNIWNHMPAVFGGSKEKALRHYAKALEILKKKPEKHLKNNWMHLNLLTLIGRLNLETGNQEEAKKYFEQVLRIEPEFTWVKEELLPSLK